MNILKLSLTLLGFLLVCYATWGLCFKRQATRSPKSDELPENEGGNGMATTAQLILIIIAGSAGAVLGLWFLNNFIGS